MFRISFTKFSKAPLTGYLSVKRSFSSIETPSFFSPSQQKPKPYSELPHTDVLIIGYIKNDIKGWKDWADSHIGLGKKLEHEMFGKSPEKLNSVYNQIADELNIKGINRETLKMDIEMIAEAGYYAGFADRSQISREDLPGDRVVFASANYSAINAIVDTKEKRAIVEKILDDAGFEHLNTVRGILEKELWTDYC